MTCPIDLRMSGPGCTLSAISRQRLMNKDRKTVKCPLFHMSLRAAGKTWGRPSAATCWRRISGSRCSSPRSPCGSLLWRPKRQWSSLNSTNVIFPHRHDWNAPTLTLGKCSHMHAFKFSATHLQFSITLQKQSYDWIVSHTHTHTTIFSWNACICTDETVFLTCNTRKHFLCVYALLKGRKCHFFAHTLQKHLHTHYGNVLNTTHCWKMKTNFLITHYRNFLTPTGNAVTPTHIFLLNTHPQLKHSYTLPKHSSFIQYNETPRKLSHNKDQNPSFNGVCASGKTKKNGEHGCRRERAKAW